MYIVLELGGQNLIAYAYQKLRELGIKDPEGADENLFDIIKGAARALQQFHKCVFTIILF